MQNKFQELSDTPLDQEAALSFPNSMFKVGEFLLKVQETFAVPGYKALAAALSSRGGIPGDWRSWFDQGVDCEILKPNARGWQKGKLKIRIAVEFCPNELEELIDDIDSLNIKVESPLDDIRQLTSS